MRVRGTDRSGSGFSDAVKVAVWTAASAVPGYNPAYVRKDRCGAVIEWENYGKTVENGTGWEIDHIFPVARGGSDNLANLQALQWQNNRFKGDSLNSAYCIIK